jgi:hypothetical protein
MISDRRSVFSAEIGAEDVALVTPSAASWRRTSVRRRIRFDNSADGYAIGSQI